jgi:hypothetical protein
MRLGHRDVQSGKILHLQSPLPITEPSLSVSNGRATTHYPMLKNAVTDAV